MQRISFCRFILSFWLYLATAIRYEGYECAVGEIGVEGWVDTSVRLCDFVC